MSETLDNPAAAGKRPTFLTVLCILSFIGAGISIILLLLGTVLAAGVSVAADAAADAGAEVTSTVGSMWAYLSVAIVMVVISLIGVIQMWKLKKTGFYQYTGAAVVGMIVPLFFGMGFSVGGAIIPIAFIVMYGLNLKAMK